MTIKEWNEWLASKITKHVATMACAYVFAAIALLAFPQAYSETFADGFHALPMVSWLSQSFLQLTLLAIIMVGQDVQSKAAEARAEIQFNAVMETLSDVREDHAAMKLIVDEMKKVMDEEDTVEADLIEIKTMLSTAQKGDPAVYQ